MSLPPVSLIGTGALGGTFLKAFHVHDLELAGAWNRTPSRAADLAGKWPDAATGAFPGGRAEVGPILLITVPDNAVAAVAGRLAGLDGSWEGHTVAHCSGALTSDALAPLREDGARTASFHPLQTFTEVSEADHFKGIWFSSEGDPEALSLLEKLAGRLDASLLRVRPEEKPYIHLAAVFASNYLVSLMQLAAEAGSAGGVDRGELIRALAPLMRQAARNIADQGPENAVSGPVARGDSETVEKHLRRLEPHPRLREHYRALGAELLDLVKRSKKFSDDRTLKKLEQLLGR